MADLKKEVAKSKKLLDLLTKQHLSNEAVSSIRPVIQQSYNEFLQEVEVIKQDSNQVNSRVSRIDKKFNKIMQELEKLDQIKESIPDLESIKKKIRTAIYNDLRRTLEDALYKRLINDPELKGEKGDPGEKGAPGKKGQRGQKGDPGEDGEDGEDGKDGSPDTPEQIQQKIIDIEKNNWLPFSYLKEVPEFALRSEMQKIASSSVIQSSERPDGSSLKNVRIINQASYDTKRSDHILNVNYSAIAPSQITISSVDNRRGRVLSIKDSGGNSGFNPITVTTQDGSLIDGDNNLIISSDYAALEIYSDGDNWFIR